MSDGVFYPLLVAQNQFKAKNLTAFFSEILCRCQFKLRNCLLITDCLKQYETSHSQSITLLSCRNYFFQHLSGLSAINNFLNVVHKSLVVLFLSVVDKLILH